MHVLVVLKQITLIIFILVNIVYGDGSDGRMNHDNSDENTLIMKTVTMTMTMVTIIHVVITGMTEMTVIIMTIMRTMMMSMLIISGYETKNFTQVLTVPLKI